MGDRFTPGFSCEQWLVTLSTYPWNSLIEKLPWAVLSMLSASCVVKTLKRLLEGTTIQSWALQAHTARATPRFTSMTRPYDTEIPWSLSIPICFLSRPCLCSLSPRYRGKGVSRSLLCRTAGVLTVWYVPITALKMSSCDMLHAMLSLGSRLASPATMTRPHSADLPLSTTLKKLLISSLTGPVRQLWGKDPSKGSWFVGKTCASSRQLAWTLARLSANKPVSSGTI